MNCCLDIIIMCQVCCRLGDYGLLTLSVVSSPVELIVGRFFSCYKIIQTVLLLNTIIKNLFLCFESIDVLEMFAGVALPVLIPNTVKTALTVTFSIRPPAFTVNCLWHPCVFSLYLTPA